jgi:hypothetical protein
MDFPPIHLLSSPAIVSASSAFETSLALNRALNDHTLVGTTLNVGVNPATVAVDLAKLSLGIDPTDRHVGPIHRIMIAVDLPDTAMLDPFQRPNEMHTGTISSGSSVVTTIDPSGNIKLARGVSPRQVQSDITLRRVSTPSGILGGAPVPRISLAPISLDPPVGFGAIPRGGVR